MSEPVSPAEISDLLRSMPGRGASTATRAAWMYRKAALLAQIAAVEDTPEAHRVAAEARAAADQMSADLTIPEQTTREQRS
jgi:hypothetical protein